MKNWIKKLVYGKIFGNYFDKFIENFSEILSSYNNIDYGRQLNPVDAFFSYRIMLGRNPNLTNEVPELLSDKQTFREFINNLLKSPEFKGFFPPNKELMIELDHGIRFWFNTNDREMGTMMASGLYEPESVEMIKKIIRPGMKCIDIGAQSGFYTCIMASLVEEQGKVYAFEPMPQNYNILLKNIKENNFQNRVEHYKLACSNVTTMIEACEFSNMFIIGKIDGAQKSMINTVRCDDVIRDHIDVIKIDIEGHEPAAIEGMKSIIQRDKPVILSEINEYWLRTCSNSNANKYLDLLVSLGYEVFNVENIYKPIKANSLNLDILDKIDIVAYQKK